VPPIGAVVVRWVCRGLAGAGDGGGVGARWWKWRWKWWERAVFGSSLFL
jgi:hypothetical protein